MQPAYYENLEEIQNKYWAMLNDAVTNRNSPFRIPVFICADQNEIDGRIVVLRKSDRENNLLQFHTDFRSSKINILKKLLVTLKKTTKIKIFFQQLKFVKKKELDQLERKITGLYL